MKCKDCNNELDDCSCFEASRKSIRGIKIAQNQEHLEAAQLEANVVRENHKKSLDKSEQEKFDIIEECVAKMVDAGIRFYLFPELATPKNGKKGAWQWNSMVALSKFNEAGKITQEDREENDLYHKSLMAAFYNVFAPAVNNDFYEFGKEMFSAIQEYYKYYNE